MPKFDLQDSRYRCPYDGKRMIVETATKAEGEEQAIHVCLNCDYKIRE